MKSVPAGALAFAAVLSTRARFRQHYHRLNEVLFTNVIVDAAIRGARRTQATIAA